MNSTKVTTFLSQLSGTLKFIIKIKRTNPIQIIRSSTASFGDLRFYKIKEKLFQRLNEKLVPRFD